MLFLTRSAFCIGLVALAASNASGSAVSAAVESGGREAARSLGGACLRSIDCMRLGSGFLNAATAPATPPGSIVQAAAPRAADAVSPPLGPVSGAALRKGRHRT